MRVAPSRKLTSEPRPVVTYRPRPSTTRIILMDSHTDLSVRSVTALLRVQGRAMGLLDIGYHFLIDLDGLVQETRPRWAMGSHTPGYNDDSVGVCLIGGRDPEGEPEDNFTEVQLLALKDLVAELRAGFGWLPVVGKTELPRYKRREVANPALDINWLRREVLPETKETWVSKTPEKHTQTSQQVVLEYLMAGRTLTQQVALACLGIGSLTSRIAELRRKGYKIKGEWRVDRFDRRYMAYDLDKDTSEYARDAEFAAVED